MCYLSQQEDNSTSFPSTPIKISAIIDTPKAVSVLDDANSESVAAGTVT